MNVLRIELTLPAATNADHLELTISASPPEGLKAAPEPAVLANLPAAGRCLSLRSAEGTVLSFCLTPVDARGRRGAPMTWAYTAVNDLPSLAGTPSAEVLAAESAA